jgi:hypothetical protein
MPKTSEMRESKFLKQTDIGAGALMTVSSCERHNVAKEGAEPEHKWCLVVRGERQAARPEQHEYSAVRAHLRQRRYRSLGR